MGDIVAPGVRVGKRDYDTGMSESEKVIYAMVGVSKTHDRKQVLKDIHLGYF